MLLLDRLTVRGFKSIRELEDFQLGPLNVLIGQNGAGKTNFLDLLCMQGRLAEGRLQTFLAEHDGPDSLLFGGRKQTDSIDVECSFGGDAHNFSLAPVGKHLVFRRELTIVSGAASYSMGSGHYESKLSEPASYGPGVIEQFLSDSMSGWRTNHFVDTSISAAVRQAQALRDNLSLKPDGSNIAPYLRHIHEQEPEHYEKIVDAVRLVAPFFGGFVYRKDLKEKLELEWIGADNPDTVLGPRQLSDGTLRFICLATLLLQPTEKQPRLILIDEPELGLHPVALTVLAELLQQVSQSRQVIVSTQSSDLVNELNPEDIFVVDREEGASTFRRLDGDDLGEWLEDYALGDLWKKNILGGRPA